MGGVRRERKNKRKGERRKREEKERKKGKEKRKKEREREEKGKERIERVCMGNVQMQMNEKEKKSDTILRKYDLLDQNRMLCLNYQNTINVKWKTQKRLNPIKKSETNRRACKLNLI